MSEPWEENLIEIEILRAEVDRLSAVNAALLEALEMALRAADELMTEFISKKRAADWGVINDGLVAAGKAIRLTRGESC